MTTTKLGLLGLLLITATSTGCGAASLAATRADVMHSPIAVVRQGTYSGELALTGSVIASHYAAEDAMIAHCGGRVRFVAQADASRLAVADPSEPGKANDAAAALSPAIERVYYVCVTREHAVHAAE